MARGLAADGSVMFRPIFHEPWWLDAVAPGQWTEVRVERNGQLRAVLPFAQRRVGPLVVLGAPPLSPYLGPLVDAGDGKDATRLKRDRELQSELVDSLPRHDVYKATFPLDHCNWPLFHERGFVGTPRITYVLDEIKNADKVWRGITDSTRNVVRKAEKRLAVRSDPDATSLVKLSAATFARQGLDLPYDATLLERVVDAVLERDAGRVLTAVDEDGTANASVLVVWDDQRAYYLVSGADPELRRVGGQTLLVWEAIKAAAGHVDSFDFEGSMVPGVERFFRSFGGAQRTYLGVIHLSRRARVAYSLREVAHAVLDR